MHDRHRALKKARYLSLKVTKREYVKDASVGGKGYPPKPGHDVTSITYGESLMALSGQGQRIDLR
jgi:hypothetical protein